MSQNHWRTRVLILILSVTFPVLLVSPPSSSAQESAKLTWSPNQESDLAGYKLYYGESQGNYNGGGNQPSPTSTGKSTSQEITGLKPGEDYYFTLTAVDTSGNESLPSEEISAVMPSLPEPPNPNGTVIEAEDMTTKTIGNAVSGGWGLLQNGYIEEAFQFPTSGTYHFDVLARGDQANGVWPTMEIRIDQNTVASLEVNSSKWKYFSATVSVQAGTHNVAIAFVNNYYAPPEDRNLYVEHTWISQEESQAGLPLTVDVSGNGTVTSSPAGIDCPGVSCNAEFPIETLVTLTAIPNSDSTFSEWGGGCSGTTSTCVVNPEIAQNVTATFIKTPPPPVSLSVAVVGDGTVTSTPSGIDCPGSACSADFDSGTSVTLTASPTNGANFSQWSGACSGSSSTCTVTLDSAQSATATFVTPTPQVSLSVGVAGNGIVTSTPTGIDCPGSACSADFDSGTSVTLTASPTNGANFSQWSGACSGSSSTCTVTLDSAQSATATFVTPTPQVSLSVAITGDGTVNSTPSGIGCPGSACSADFDSGTSVTITASPANGANFSQWSGACSGNSTSCTVSLDNAKNATATFVTSPPPPPPSPEVMILEAEDMFTKTTGTAVSNGWNIWQNGYLEESTTFATTGLYQFEVRARGDLAAGVWPQMEIRIDQTTVASIQVNSSTWSNFSATVPVQAGTRKVAIAFVNNYYAPPQDRNLYADRVSIMPGEEIPPSSLITLEAEDMSTKTTGTAVSNGWNIWQNGYLEESATFATTGLYQFEVRARGDLAAGVWPQMEIRIDQTTVASIQVNSSTWSNFSATVPVQAGTRKVAIAFVNNYYAPPQDRNLYADRVSIMPGEEIPPSSLITLEAEDMSTKTTGTAVSNGWNIWQNGYLEESATFATTGLYQFEVRARGDLAAGAWPQMEIRIDQATVASIQVNSSTWGNFSTMVPVQAGTHDVAIAFVNNYYAPPEDRNLYVDKVSMIETAGSSSSSVTTLLIEDFNNGDITDWTIVDGGTHQGPSAWSASTGTLVQSSNIYTLPGDRDSLDKTATHIFYNAGMSWINYDIGFNVRSDDNDAVGVMFRYQDSNNYYRFSWDLQRKYRRLIKRENGVFYLLAEDAIPYAKGKNYLVEVGVQDNTYTVVVDGAQIFSVNDTSSLSTGTIGFYSWANRGGHFDNVNVTGPNGVE